MIIRINKNIERRFRLKQIFPGIAGKKSVCVCVGGGVIDYETLIILEFLTPRVCVLVVQLQKYQNYGKIGLGLPGCSGFGL